MLLNYSISVHGTTIFSNNFGDEINRETRWMPRSRTYRLNRVNYVFGGGFAYSFRLTSVNRKIKYHNSFIPRHSLYPVDLVGLGTSFFISRTNSVVNSIWGECCEYYKPSSDPMLRCIRSRHNTFSIANHVSTAQGYYTATRERVSTECNKIYKNENGAFRLNRNVALVKFSTPVGIVKTCFSRYLQGTKGSFKIGDFRSIQYNQFGAIFDNYDKNFNDEFNSFRILHGGDR